MRFVEKMLQKKIKKRWKYINLSRYINYTADSQTITTTIQTVVAVDDGWCAPATNRKQRRIKPFPLLNRHHQLYVFNFATVLINLNLPAGTASMYTKLTTPSFLPLPILIDVLPAVHGNCTIIFQMPNELLLLWLYCHCSSSQPIPPNDIINCNNRHHHHGLH